jgi:hypothetical protein
MSRRRTRYSTEPKRRKHRALPSKGKSTIATRGLAKRLIISNGKGAACRNAVAFLEQFRGLL